MPLPTQSQTVYAQTLRASPSAQDQSSQYNTIKSTLNLQPHPEGGYFVETDRDQLQVPNPFHNTPIYPNATVKQSDNTGLDTTPTRNASTTIHYYLDPASPNGFFHRNKARTVHTLHWGRGIYVLIHADEVKPGHKARIETLTVGANITAGEKVQWIVDGGKFKASFLIPDSDDDDDEDQESEEGLLISETVVPGFDFMDHDFLTWEQLLELVEEEDAEKLRWLINRGHGKK